MTGYGHEVGDALARHKGIHHISFTGSPTVGTLIQQVAGALQHAHQKGVIHRDLKPSNLMVVVEDAAPQVKVIDFGVARMMGDTGSEVTLAGQQWGTPAYMSPEQLAGQPVDTRTDIFSLGLTLYELLSGLPAREPQKPETAPSMQAPSRRLGRLPLMEQETSATQRGLSARQLSAQLRGDLDWIILKAAAAEPSQRYESAGALRDDLERYLSGQAVLAGPPSLTYWARKFIRRNKGKLAASTLAVLALVAVSIISVIYARQAERAQRGMREALYDARLTQAQALRRSGRPGQRLGALAAVAAAAQIRVSPQLRDEALAAMALPDLEVVASLDVMPEKDGFADYDFDSDLLVVGSYQNPVLERYHLRTGERLAPYHLPGMASGFIKFRIAPGGQRGVGYGLAAPDQEFTAMAILDTALGEIHGVVFDARSDREPAMFYDGTKRLATGMNGGGMAVCDGETGKVYHRIPSPEKVESIYAEETTRRLLVSMDSGRSWLIPYSDDAAPVELPSPAHCFRGALSPDGRIGLFGSMQGAFTFFNPGEVLAGGAPVFEVRPGHTDMVTFLHHASGGQYWLSSSWDRSTRLWTAGGGGLLSMDGRVFAMTQDGGHAAMVQGNRISLLRLAAAVECPAVSDYAKFKLRTALFSPDGKMAAISSAGRSGAENQGGTLLCRLPDLTPVATLGVLHTGAGFSAEGTKLISSGLATEIWDLSGLSPAGPGLPRLRAGTRLAEGTSQCVAVSADGRWFAAAMGQNRPENERAIRIFRQDTLAPGPVITYDARHFAVSGLAFAPAGQWLVSHYWKGAGFDVWDTVTGAHLAQGCPETESLKLDVNPTGTLMVTASASEMKIWTTSDWSCRRTLPLPAYSPFAHEVAWSPQGDRIACEGDRGQVRITEAATDELLATLTLPQNEPVSHLAWSPDGKTLAVSTPQQTFFYDLRKAAAHLLRLGIPSSFSGR